MMEEAYRMGLAYHSTCNMRGESLLAYCGSAQCGIAAHADVYGYGGPSKTGNNHDLRLLQIKLHCIV